MKQTNPLWGSISILIGAVIAILAFVRGSLRTPLLLAAFAVWALWVLLRHFVPLWRDKRLNNRNKKRVRQVQDELTVAGIPNMEVAQMLLRHINHRISSQLQSAYPDVRWEWAERNPALLAFRGGIGRIRLYGVPDFDYADVQLDQNANLTCALVKAVSCSEAAADSTSQPQINPQAWYETHGRKVLEAMVADTNSRGFNRLILKEDGSVCTVLDSGDEIVEDTIRSFLPKVYWPQLVRILEQDGLSASVQPEYVSISW